MNDQNKDGHTALMFAYNSKNQVETLPKHYNHFISETGLALVDLLLMSGSDPTWNDQTPILKFEKTGQGGKDSRRKQN